MNKKPAKPATPAPPKQAQPLWQNPTLWVLVVSGAAMFCCVAPWQSNLGKSTQGASSVLGKVALGACLLVTSSLSMVVTWRPQPKWVAYPPVAVGGVLLLIGAIYALTEVDRSSGSFGKYASKFATTASGAGLAWGFYLYLLMAAALLGLGIYQLVPRPRASTAAAPARPAAKKPAPAARRK
jgi:xanthine/uracil permease